MADRRATTGADGGAEDIPWLTAYADLITAILAVIVLMLSTGVFDTTGDQRIVEAPAPQAMPEPRVEQPADANGPRVPESQLRETERLEQLRRRLERVVFASALDRHVRLALDQRGLAVIIEGAALFESGKWDLHPEQLQPFLPLLQAIATASGGRTVEIEGHTDDVGSDAYNLQLSTQRALAMLDFWVAQGHPTWNLRLAAFGETRPARPLQPWMSEDRMAEVRNANRRIAFMIHRQQ